MCAINDNIFEKRFCTTFELHKCEDYRNYVLREEDIPSNIKYFFDEK